MSWLLFMDESGHDHRQLPYEVRGGVALHAGKLWPFTQAMRRLERDAFGVELSTYKKELKGSKLLERRTLKWAAQADPLPANHRRRLCRRFLQKGLTRAVPVRDEFTAFGQANRAMADGIFALLPQYGALVFAVAVAPEAVRGQPPADRLRRDHVVLLRRYERFLKEKGEYGLLVMDETDKDSDRRFVRRVQAHFLREGWRPRQRRRLVPNPLFVSSDMTPAVQAADLCIYCVNWGFRLDGMTKPTRADIARDYAGLLGHLCFVPHGCKSESHGKEGSITYVADLHPQPRRTGR